jgi:hypothetical protein
MSNRCDFCKKKLGLLFFPCNCCKKDFCINHRIPEDHKCIQDYKKKAHDLQATKLMDQVVAQTHNYIKI